MTFDEFITNVYNFNDAIGSVKTKNFGLQLSCLIEELGEMTEAINKDSGTLHAMEEWADVLYVLLGVPFVMGWPTEFVREALKQVARKNAAKLEKKLSYSSTGKLLK